MCCYSFSFFLFLMFSLFVRFSASLLLLLQMCNSVPKFYVCVPGFGVNTWHILEWNEQEILEENASFFAEMCSLYNRRPLPGNCCVPHCCIISPR